MFCYTYIFAKKNGFYVALAEVLYLSNSTSTYVVCVTSGCAKHRFTRFQTPETHAIDYQFTSTPMDRAISPSTKHQWANPSCDKAPAVHQHSSSPTPRSQEMIQWQKICAYKWSWAFSFVKPSKMKIWMCPSWEHLKIAT